MNGVNYCYDNIHDISKRKYFKAQNLSLDNTVIRHDVRKESIVLAEGNDPLVLLIMVPPISSDLRQHVQRHTNCHYTGFECVTNTPILCSPFHR
jgi:hypothetical protein